MLPEDIKRLVIKYKNEITILNKNIVDLQEKCSHDNYEIKNISTSTAVFRNVCTTCEKIIGYPTDKEFREAGY